MWAQRRAEVMEKAGDATARVPMKEVWIRGEKKRQTNVPDATCGPAPTGLEWATKVRKRTGPKSMVCVRMFS